MKIKDIYLSVLSVIFLFAIQSCDTTTDKNDSPENRTSKIQLKLIDEPDDNYLEVWVDIIDIKYNRTDDDTGWTSFNGYPVEEGSNRVDLRTLIAGSSHVLTNQDIESGMLNKIRIILGNNNSLVIEGEDGEIPLKTPSAQQSGLKIHLETDLAPGFSYTFVLDWDVKKSIVKAGNSGYYNLKPVIRAHTEINAGTIIGQIAQKIGDTDSPIEGAEIEIYSIDNATEALTSTFTNNDGVFELAVLPIGNYILKIRYSNIEYNYDELMYPETGSIIVNKDETVDIGLLYLTKSSGSIVGRVADSSETETNLFPLGNATIEVYDKDDTLFENIITSVQTINLEDESKGTFEIMNLPQGEYILKVSLNEYDEKQSDIILVKMNETINIGTILLNLT